MLRRRVRATFATTIVVLTACTGGGSKPLDRPARFESIDCPPEIVSRTHLHVSCGYLVVPQDRNEAEGSIRVFVSRWEPKIGAVAPIPVLYLGEDLGFSFDYVSVNGLIDHLVDRVIYAMEPRGVGQSQPNLTCPEIDALASSTLSVPSNDPPARSAFLDAVGTCHDRIVAQGIDPADFSVEAAAADAEDLRIALGVDRWDLLTKGTTSRIAAEYLRRFGTHVHAAFLSQAELPGMDPLALSIRGTREALATLGSACTGDPRCERAFPHFRTDVDALITRLQAHPLTIHVPIGSIFVDGAMLIRAIRTALSRIPDVHRGDGTRFVAILEAAARDPSEGLREFAERSRVGSTYCDGYLPRCPSAFGLASGVYLSILCRDIVPFVDTEEVEGRARGSASWKEAFSDDPWVDACGRWSVPPAIGAVGSPISSSVPTFLVAGTFDPYDPPPAVRAAARGLSQMQFDERPQGHLPFAADCESEIRRAFYIDPIEPFNPSCTNSLRFRFSISPR
jgi:pimeloyl-ACP methyl ester carboxylesterase